MWLMGWVDDTLLILGAWLIGGAGPPEMSHPAPVRNELTSQFVGYLVLSHCPNDVIMMCPRKQLSSICCVNKFSAFSVNCSGTNKGITSV